jgi:hypothetical protein
MTDENYNRAKEIEKELIVLNISKTLISVENVELSFLNPRDNKRVYLNNMNHTNYNLGYLFKEEYQKIVNNTLKKIDKRINDLQKEFDKM